MQMPPFISYPIRTDKQIRVTQVADYTLDTPNNVSFV